MNTKTGKVLSIPSNGNKDKIYYSRTYRKLPQISRLHAFIMLLFVLVLDVLVFVFRRKLTFWVSYTAWYLARFFEAGPGLAQVKFMGTHIFAVDTMAVYPGPEFAFANLFVSIIALALLGRVQRLGAPLAYWMFYAFIVHLVSSLFFIFFPQYFPYSILEITGLYMEVELVTWLLIPPIVLGSVFLYPVSMLGKALLILATLGYSFIFGAVRLAVFLFVLHYGSVIFMAILFFVFGSLVDFIYIVGFYSVYITRAANSLAGRRDVWKWLS